MKAEKLARSLAAAGKSYELRVSTGEKEENLGFDIIVQQGENGILLALEAWSPTVGPVASSRAFRYLVSKAYRLVLDGFKVDFIGAYNGLYLAIFKLTGSNVAVLKELSSVEGRTYVLDVRPSMLAYYRRFKPKASSTRNLLESLLKGSMIPRSWETLINDLDDLRYVIVTLTKGCEDRKALETILKSIVEVKDLNDAVKRVGCTIDSKNLGDIDSWLYELLEAYGPLRVVEAIGFLYERLTPGGERRKSGIFFTPKKIVELIVEWAIDKPDIRVLDPGCGTGAFLIEAYRRAKGLCKTRGHCHDNIRIVGVEVDPLSAKIARLTVRLASKGKHEPLIVVGDYFGIDPEKLGGLFDAVIGNPPYTRWTMLSTEAKAKVLEKLGVIIKRYGLTPDPKRGVEPGLHVFWIINSHRFLREGGKLAMIVSDSWMQASYGKRLLEYILDNFNIKAIIDFGSRPFNEPMVGACILFLEKKEARKERGKATLVYVEGDPDYIDPTDLIKIIDVFKEADKPVNVERTWGSIKIRVTSEETLRKGWYNIPSLMLGVDNILSRLARNPLTVKLSDYFEISFSNITYLYLASKGVIRGVRNVGGESFFYLTEDEVKRLSIPREYLHPLIPSPRHLIHFTFTRDDWEELRRRGEKCYLFLAHKPREDLPEPVRKYIEMGEKGDDGLVLSKGPRGGRPISRSSAARARESSPRFFYGWYDLGGVEPTLAYASYGFRYWVRFVMPDSSYALDNRIIAFIPKKNTTNFSTLELKALLAYLNSSFTQLQAEAMGRVAGGVALLEVDVKPLSNFMVLNVSKIDKPSLYSLARLFEALEAEARRLGGADTASSIYGDSLRRVVPGWKHTSGEGLFNTIIREIDSEVASILGLEGMESEVRTAVLKMASRRLARARPPRFHLS